VYNVSLQKGHSALRGDKKENQVILAKNKINKRTDSKLSSPRIFPNALGTERVGNKVRKWLEELD
jgi:hypothetical protein